MSKIALLIEQTMFLVDKEKGAFAEINQKMNQFLDLLQTKINAYKDEESKETLKAIETHLKHQQEDMATNIQEDIDFLTQQLKVMEEVSKIEDSARREELANMIIHEAGELLTMDTFKKQIEEQSLAAKQDFFSMLEDMEAAINEGKEEELLALMNASAEEIEDDECCDSDECDDSCQSDEVYRSCGDDSCQDECCDDEEDDEDDADDVELTNDLLRDLERAQAAVKKKCCRSDENCNGACRCKKNC